MITQLTQLQRLQDELHEINQELSTAARPLARLDDLKEPERRQVAARIRAGIARWEAISDQIARVFGVTDEAADGSDIPRGTHTGAD